MTTREEATHRFYIAAGETSGDRHAADLLVELLKIYPKAWFGGVGGRYLRGSGQDQLFDLSLHAVVGLTDVLPKIFTFLGFFKKIIADIEEKQPNVVILVDNPAFNLRLAKKIRQRFPDIKIVYYISPQVWAWKKGRAKAMSNLVHLLLLIFPFEKKWYDVNAPEVQAKWIGHPVMDRWKIDSTEIADEDETYTISLMPGSRRKEIKAHLPMMLETAEKLNSYQSGLEFIILAADDRARSQIEQIMGEGHAKGLPIEIQQGYQLTRLRRCKLAFVASGTATLECCLAHVPMFVVYKVHPVTYIFGRILVKLPYLSIVNILAREKVVPEFLQDKANAEHLFEATRKFIKQPAWSEKMKEKLQTVSSSLGKPGVNKRAAQAIREMVDDFTNDKE
ncbi:MAG: lipid-A-disaccharide synthase [Verrucomicrobiota bacterium]